MGKVWAVRKRRFPGNSTISKIGKRYEAWLPLKERIDICDKVLPDDDFEIYVRNGYLMVYSEDLGKFWTDIDIDDSIYNLVNNYGI